MTHSFFFFQDGKLKAIQGQVPEENRLVIKINGDVLTTISCSPEKLTFLVIGFLYLEGVINHLSELLMIKVCDQELVADVLTSTPFDCKEFSRSSIMASACTGGATSGQKQLKKIDESIKTVVEANNLFSLMKSLYHNAATYLATGGLHSSGISTNGKEIIALTEDIGRHNTISRLAGECLVKKISTRGGILLTTGRISSDMVEKASRMEICILVSRTSPTSLAVSLAQSLNITIVGYLRGGKFKIYSHPWRVKL
jgi:FdhD protein